MAIYGIYGIYGTYGIYGIYGIYGTYGYNLPRFLNHPALGDPPIYGFTIQLFSWTARHFAHVPRPMSCDEVQGRNTWWFNQQLEKTPRKNTDLYGFILFVL